MPDITVYVDGTTSGTAHAGGAHYASLNAALAAECAAGYDLVNTLGGILNIEISLTTQDGVAATVPACLTDDTHYVNIYTTAGARHAGVYSTSKYRLEKTNNNSLTINARHVRISGLQISETSSDASSHNGVYITTITAGGANIILDGCIVRHVLSGGTGASYTGVAINDVDATVTLRNCVVYGWDGGTGADVGVNISNAATVTLQNCAVTNNQRGVVRSGGTVNCINTYSGGNSESGYDFSGTITYATCACEDNITASGLAKQIAFDTTVAAGHAGFTSITPGGAGYIQPATGSVLIDAGTDVAASNPKDATGTSFAVRNDIGAFEYASADTTAPTITAMHLRRLMSV